MDTPARTSQAAAPRGRSCLTTIQSDPLVPPGTLPSLARRAGIAHRNVRLDLGAHLPAPGGLDGVVILGGMVGPWDEERAPFLRDLKSFCRTLVARGIPCLGIALGAQVLAEVLGADVRRERRPERGVTPLHLNVAGRRDPLFWGLPPQFPVFQWHENRFDLPEGAVALACTETCSEQAFRFGASTYAVPFHPEAEESVVVHWGGVQAVRALRCLREIPWTAADHLLLNFLDLLRGKGAK